MHHQRRCQWHQRIGVCIQHISNSAPPCFHVHSAGRSVQKAATGLKKSACLQQLPTYFVCVRRSTKSRLGGLNRRCLPRSSLSVGLTVSVTRPSNELNIKWVLAAGRGVLGCFAQRSSLMLRLARVSDARATAQQSVLEHKWPAKLPMASAFCGSRQRASFDNLSQYPIAAPQGTPFPTLR